jgi:hypothetical protein
VGDNLRVGITTGGQEWAQLAHKLSVVDKRINRGVYRSYHAPNLPRNIMPISVCFLPGVAFVLSAQQAFLWQGAVKAPQTDLYNQPTLTDSVARTLGHGVVVNVLLKSRYR